jgi:hypothetical protein
MKTTRAQNLNAVALACALEATTAQAQIALKLLGAAAAGRA